MHILNIKNLCDYYFFESCVTSTGIRIRAKVWTNSAGFIETLKTSVRKIQDKRQIKRGSVCTQESRYKKTSHGAQHQQIRVFGPVTTQRNIRRGQLPGGLDRKSVV
jgi:hypothetical protein